MQASHGFPTSIECEKTMLRVRGAATRRRCRLLSHSARARVQTLFSGGRRAGEPGGGRRGRGHRDAAVSGQINFRRRRAATTMKQLHSTGEMERGRRKQRMGQGAARHRDEDGQGCKANSILPLLLILILRIPQILVYLQILTRQSHPLAY